MPRKSNKNTKNNENKKTIPANIEKLVYTPEDIQKFLGRGRRQTYDLIHEGRFPVKKVGNQYLIPKQPFHDWLNNGSMYNLKTL